MNLHLYYVCVIMCVWLSVCARKWMKFPTFIFIVLLVEEWLHVYDVISTEYALPEPS